MQRIREKQAKVASQKDKERLDPQSHGEGKRKIFWYLIMEYSDKDKKNSKNNYYLKVLLKHQTRPGNL